MLIHSYHVDSKFLSKLGHDRLWVRPILTTVTGVAKRFWTGMLMAVGRIHEPQIWKTQDRSGQPSWSAYDPSTRKTVENLTEDEMRIWLEKRYA